LNKLFSKVIILIIISLLLFPESLSRLVSIIQD